MGKPHKHARADSPAELYQRARRLYEKGDFKQAYKEAKVCHSRCPTAENRRLLEQVWIARAKMQHRTGFEAESRQTVQSLLDFGPTDPDVQRELPSLLVTVGLFDRAVSGKGVVAVEVNPALVAAAADQAVMKPSEAAQSIHGIRQGAAMVRAALEALCQNDEAKALAELKDVPRSSPFADWKLFVRGLAAYYRGNPEEMQGNWDRLEANRSAASIASCLSSLARSQRPDPGSHAHRAVHALEKAVFGDSLIACLGSMRDALAEGRWDDLLRSYRQFRPMFRRCMPEIAQRIERIVANYCVRTCNERALKSLMSHAEPPPLDPGWNRIRALLCEHPEIRQTSMSRAVSFWRAYIVDLRELPALTLDERTLAEGLVWDRIGRLHLDDDSPWADEYWDEDADEYSDDASVQPEGELSTDSTDDDSSDDSDDDSDDDMTPPHCTRAVAAFREAIRVAPTLLPAYQGLIEAWEDADKPERAADARRQLLRQFPDDVETLVAMYEYHARRDEPAEAKPYALHARRLKPANAQMAGFAWNVHMQSVRHCAAQGRWELGREEIAAAEAVVPPPYEPYCTLVRKAVFEHKAGCPEAFALYVEQAKASMDDPAAVYFLLTIEGTRYGLPFTVLQQFEDQWVDGMRRKRLSTSAGRMSRLLLSYFVAGTDYSGRAAHLTKIADYLRRCVRQRWSAADLRDACLVLVAAFKEKADHEIGALLDNLVARGLNLCPESALFPMLAGGREIHKGPRHCNRRRASEHFEKVLALTRSSSEPEAIAMATEAQEHLDFLSEAAERAFSRPPKFFRLDDADEDEDDFYEDEDEDDEGDVDYGPMPVGLPPPVLFDMIRRMCRQHGVSMKDLINGIDDELPPDLAAALAGMASQEKPARKKPFGRRR